MNNNTVYNPFWREHQCVRLMMPIELLTDVIMRRIVPYWPFNTQHCVWSERVALECARGTYDEHKQYWGWYWIAFYHGFSWDRMVGRWWLRRHALIEWWEHQQ